MIHLDMSEYSEKISSTRLSGASPGYVGYEEGSVLVVKISKNPYSVILFDEIEKAHPDVIQCMLQILEEGRLTDGLGRVGDFRNSIIIITGNIGSDIINKGPGLGFNISENSEQIMQAKIIEKASEQLKPEFVNRLTEIIMYKPFDSESLSKIFNLEINPIKLKLKEKGITLKVSNTLKNKILSQLKDSKFGARPLERIIEKEIEDPLATLIISNKIKSGDEIYFSSKADSVVFNIKEAQVLQD
jgi:ATP-dependent Clp protease ATP-binding subunit ClpC